MLHGWRKKFENVMQAILVEKRVVKFLDLLIAVRNTLIKLQLQQGTEIQIMRKDLARDSPRRALSSGNSLAYSGYH